ncbi:MAG: tetratricopeptide repeat protein [Saprospiraceae bacterium]
MSKKRQKNIKKPIVTNIVKDIKKTTALPDFWSNKSILISLFGALLITFLCFYNTTDNAFVNWDDDKNFYENQLITSLNKDNFWSNTKEIFTTSVIGNYNPLSIWTFAIEKRMYGLDKPGKWHLTNVLIHLLCVFFVFRISLLLGLRWQGALLVSLLFGIHPMRVESVAWVTERKDVLFGAFYLAALYYYIKQKLSGKNYFLLILLLFILSLLSKIQAVIFPISMLLIDYYLDDKIDLKTILKKAPFFLLSLVFGLAGIFVLKGEGSFDSSTVYPMWQRIFVGSYSYLVYLAKLIVPFEMSPLYPYPSKVPTYFYATILAVPTLLYALYYAYKRNLKIWVFGLLFFTANIVFLLQILGAGQGFLADRFTYIAYFGLFFIIGYFFDKYLTNQKLKLPLIGIATIGLLSYGYTTVNQNKVWQNSETLWTKVLKHYDKTTLPYGNRANYRRDNGQIQGALSDYSQSIALKPSAQAYNSRARLYFQMGKENLNLALQDYNKAIEMTPNDGEFLINRGATFARLGQIDKGIDDINKGLKLKPDHVAGYINRSVLYNGQGKVELALKDINSYLKLRPYNADIWYEKARALRGLNKLEEAIPAYNQAIKLNRSNGLFFYERARTYAFINKIELAKKDLTMAIQLNYKNIDPSFKQHLGF